MTAETLPRPPSLDQYVIVRPGGYPFRTIREDALHYGWGEATPDEAAYLRQENERRRREAAEREAAAWATYDAAMPQLDALTGLTTRAVLDLHAPVWGNNVAGWRAECHGCDAEGHDWEPPGWPCRTVEAVAQVLGIALPDGWHLRKERDRETGEWVRPQ